MPSGSISMESNPPVNNDVQAPPPTQSSADAPSQPPKATPTAVKFTIGNTYTRLPPSSASYDKLTGRHLKIHDWTLYVDVLPGYDPDIIDKVTFDMRDDSFVTTAFTCHCPIRIRSPKEECRRRRSSSVGTTKQSSYTEGQSTKEEAKCTVSTSRPHPNNSRWRFSTRQQTYGAVDVQITIRGRGGCRCTLPYKVKLIPGGYEHPLDDDSIPLFIEKRSHHTLKPLKMDGAFGVVMNFGVQQTAQDDSERDVLLDIAKSIYSRSKQPIRALLENTSNGESWTEKLFGFTKPNAASVAWSLKMIHSKVDTRSTYANSKSEVAFSILSPNLTGGNGLNECYKIIEGLPSSLPAVSTNHTLASFHVQIDVSNLSTQQIIKVCQNFIKYEDAIDSLMPWNRREDRCFDCRSNKEAMSAQYTTNKQRNVRIAKCESLKELVQCLNPAESQRYKLDLQHLIEQNNANGDHAVPTIPNQALEFRQGTSSKDKTAVTHWIRFCMSFVRNSARLRAPMALKGTTSLEEEFDLLFEYVVKDRALRDYYKERRDALMIMDEETTYLKLAEESLDDSMSISDCSRSNEEDTSLLKCCRKREAAIEGTPAMHNKRTCL
eukprot:scaffold106_cov209-Alexandrium_tamarense.AAC.41